MFNTIHFQGRASAQLYGDALALEMRAERCRAVALVLDTRRTALTERHQPVLELHNDTVWKGRAASASRARLQRVTGMSLYLLGLELAATSRALLSEAETLAQEAAVLRSQAQAAEAAEAARRREAAEAAQAAEQARGRNAAQAARTARGREGALAVHN